MKNKIEDKIEIRMLRIELQRVLKMSEIYRKRNEIAIDFIEKYAIFCEETPQKLGLSIKETNELLELLKKGDKYEQRGIN